MTRLFNNPAQFTDDMLEGFLDANARYVVGVPGGVVRTTATPAGKVAVVVGGGAGHYPAFCGVVGSGFADGAVVGNIFTSPSAADAESVARAVDGGAGVLLITGNYAGDVMNFGVAVQKLQADGVNARYLAVTDDIASAPKSQMSMRRGIAGDFTVFRCASAAAEAGLGFDDVERVGIAANNATRSLGVAFDGCTLPGAATPLFSVEPGSMGLGLGIHGEPGVSSNAMPTAADLADLLVDKVLDERPPASGDRIAVVLNGLGRTKYEELFVVWRTVARRLREAGYTVVDPEVGELVTSLDMAGCSLTIMWLDDELEKLWTSPADTPAYRKGVVSAGSAPRRSADAGSPAPATEIPESDEESRSCAQFVARALDAVAGRMVEAEQELGRIDAIAGDGDHGRGMVKGTAAARLAAAEAVGRGGGVGTVLDAAGAAWAAKAGGTSGVLWGAALTAAGKRLGDSGTPSDHDVAETVRAGCDAIVSLGGASPGDKTMLDALLPFAAHITAGVSAGQDWRTAWAGAVEVATAAGTQTAQLRPKVGRARPLAERSIGAPDPGAVSMAMCAATVAHLFSTAKESR